MAMIAPLTGTTSDYQSVVDSLILNDREIGVEIASREDGSTYSIVRQGNGRDKFFDLPKLFDQSAYEDAMKITISNAETVTQLAEETAAKSAESQASATAALASETKAKASETASKTSETNAKASEEAAKSYMDSAEEYKNQAFSATPEGYEANVQKLNDMDIQTATGENLTLAGTKIGGIKLNSIKGKSVQDGEPTPDYPIEIESVGDGGSVVVKSCGKNLYDEKTFNKNYTGNGITCAVQSDGALKFSGTSTAQVNAIMNQFELKAGTYTYSAVGRNKVNICLYSITDKKFIAYNPTNTFTLSKDSIVDLRMQFDISVAVDETINIQFEKGTVATDYEPYHSTEITIPLSEPLRSIGDVKDEIVMQDGKWGVLRRIGAVTIDGSKSFTRYANGRGLYIFGIDGGYITKNAPSSDQGVYVCCTHYEPKSTYDIYWISSIITAIGFIGNKIRIIDDRFDNADDLNNWIASNPLSCIYILETPTFEPFSDQTPFYGLASFDGVTNIITDQTIEPTMEVEYGKSMVGAYTLENHSEIAKQSSLVDTVTGKSGVFSLEDGILCIREA